MNINNGVINLNSPRNNDTRFYIVFTIFIYLFAGHSSTFHKKFQNTNNITNILNFYFLHLH